MFEYTEALKQLNNAENVYGREIGMVNKTINNKRIRANELRDKIQKLKNNDEESLENIEELYKT